MANEWSSEGVGGWIQGGRERDAMEALMWLGTQLPMKINTEEGVPVTSQWDIAS